MLLLPSPVATTRSSCAVENSQPVIFEPSLCPLYHSLRALSAHSSDASVVSLRSTAMIDIYGLDETAGTWRQKAAALAADVVARHTTDVDTNARFPSESLAALAQGGFYGLCIDTHFGGQGQGPATFAAVVEELARHCGSTAMVYVMHVAAAKVIEASATLPTKADVLRAIAEGKYLTTFALSERGSRSQFWAPVSQLVEQENGYRTDAFKSWSTAAHHADAYVASAQRPG